MANDFNGKEEFAAGDVRGTRAFRVDEKGRLKGVVYETVWKPGENVAVCYRGVDPEEIKYRPGGWSRGVVSGSSGAFTPVPGRPGNAGGTSRFGPISAAAVRAAGGLSSVNPAPSGTRCTCGCNQLIADLYQRSEAPCSGVEVHCQCGFYAYQEGSNDYFTPTGSDPMRGMVGAVVRGYGRVVLGTRGFRAAKAEILAIYMDPALKLDTKMVANQMMRFRIEQLYKVPVFDDYLAMMREFPVDLPEPDEGFWDKP